MEVLGIKKLTEINKFRQCEECISANLFLDEIKRITILQCSLHRETGDTNNCKFNLIFKLDLFVFA